MEYSCHIFKAPPNDVGDLVHEDLWEDARPKFV